MAFENKYAFFRGHNGEAKSDDQVSEDILDLEIIVIKSAPETF